MSTKQYPTAEYLWQCFRYENGKLFWIKRPLSHFESESSMRSWSKTKIGKEAGYCAFMKGEYRHLIRLNKKNYYRHRIVWVMKKGEVPGIIDHINRITNDDRIENLREATISQNSINSRIRKGNSSGVRGVDWRSDAKLWRARINVNGKAINIGYFKTIEEAAAARAEASVVHYGEFSNEAVYNGNHKSVDGSKTGICSRVENRPDKNM